MAIMTTSEADGRIKATLTVSLPSPGYELHIREVIYADGKAVIRYAVDSPRPGLLYPQVITEAEAFVYLAGAPAEVTAEQIGRTPGRADAKLLE